MFVKFWFSCASSAALLMIGVAQAQTTSASLEEIIVTAQKVSTNVQTTPIAVQTVSSAEVTAAGVSDAKDLNRLFSSLSVQEEGGSGSNFFIRGVGNVNGNPNGDSGVAVDLDQIYFSRPYGPDLSFYDIERIEVLKGPQGTLYGRNATGGVINIISTKPTIGNFGGYARVELGNYGEVRTNAAVDLPILPTLEARVAFQTNVHNGYLTDGYDDSKTQGGRVHLLWAPTSALSVLLTAEYDHAGGHGNESVPAPNNRFLTSNPWAGTGSPQIMSYISALAQQPPFANQGTLPRYFTGPGSCYPGCLRPGLLEPVGQPYQVNDNGFIDTTTKSLRADMEWNFDFATLSVIPGMLNTYYNTIFFLGPPPLLENGFAHQQSLEIRLASPQNQRLTWLVGASGQQERQGYIIISDLGIPFAYAGTFQPDVEDHAAGVFAQTSFAILPTLSLITGARYTKEHKNSFNETADNAAIVPFLAVHATAPENRVSSVAPTWRIGLDWMATPDNFLYTSFATGFHSGGLEFGLPPTRQICVPVYNGTPAQFIASETGCDAAGSYKPEHLKAYTIGSKNRFLDNRFQINAEIYDWKYTDLQVGTLGLSNPMQTNQVVVNAGNASIRGVDLEARAQITAHDEAGISGNYNRSRYGQLEFANFIVGSPFPPNVNNFSGRSFINAPDVTFTVHYQHIFDFGDGTITPLVSAQHSSTVLYSLEPLQSQAGYTKVDLALTYRSAQDRYELSLFGRNVGNVATLNSSGGSDSSTGLPFVNIAPPRTFGGSVQVKF